MFLVKMSYKHLRIILAQEVHGWYENKLNAHKRHYLAIEKSLRTSNISYIDVSDIANGKI